MPNVALYDITGKVIGDIELSENVFGQPVNEPVLHQVVVAHLANCRQGTQSAKTRSEVSGGGKKPYRQKGTGRARQGSTRAPQWTHGGVVFAPKPRDYTQQVNRKVKRIALKSALSSKVADSELIVFDALNIEAPKTKEMVKVLKAVDVEKALIVLPEKDETVERAAANIPGVKTTLVGTLNKKAKRLALKSALSAKVAETNLVVIDSIKMDAPKTAEFAKFLAAVGCNTKSLVVTAEADMNVVKSGRNIPGCEVTFANLLNVYDIVNANKLVVDQAALAKIVEVFA